MLCHCCIAGLEHIIKRPFLLLVKHDLTGFEVREERVVLKCISPG